MRALGISRLWPVSLHAVHLLGLAVWLVTAGTMTAQIYIATQGHSIGVYTTTGATVNASLVTGPALANPFGMTLGGTNLYVTNYGSRTVSEFTTSGVTVADPLISEVGTAYGVVVNGGNVFIAHGGGAVRKYALNGTLLDANFITGVGPFVGLALADGYFYVTSYSGGTVGKYALDGTVVDTGLISGLTNPYAIAVSGSELYVTSNTGINWAGIVGKYSTSGDTLAATLISGFGNPLGIAVAENSLFVTDYLGGTVGKYATDGTVLNASLVSGLNHPTVLAVAVPEVARTELGFAVLIGAFVFFQQIQKSKIYKISI